MRIERVVRVRGNVKDAATELARLGCEVLVARHFRGVTTAEVVIRKQLDLDRVAIAAYSGRLELAN